MPATALPLHVGGKYEIASLAQEAYDGIRRMIHSGEFPPGAQIHERVMTEKLGLSRTPIRQALTRLASEGLVERIPRAGVFVRRLDATEMVELVELRRALEAASASMAAAQISPEQVEGLKALAVELENCPETLDLERNRSMELRFHRRICEHAGNREIARVLDQTHTIYLTLFPAEKNPQIFVTSPGEHRRIAEAIARGDAAEAYRAVWQHFDLVLARLRGEAGQHSSQGEET